MTRAAAPLLGAVIEGEEVGMDEDSSVLVEEAVLVELLLARVEVTVPLVWAVEVMVPLEYPVEVIKVVWLALADAVVVLGFPVVEEAEADEAEAETEEDEADEDEAAAVEDEATAEVEEGTTEATLESTLNRGV